MGTGMLIVLAVVVVGLIALEIFLSKTESKWPGLILPIIFLVISLLNVFGIMIGPPMDTATLVVTCLYGFGIFNIPTVILLIIYAVRRRKRKKQRELEKMNDDLKWGRRS